MRRLTLGLVLSAGLLIGQIRAEQDTGTAATAAPSAAPAGAVPSALTPCEAAEGDVLTLRARVLQLEAQAAAAQLEAERTRLEAKYRERLKPPADQVFDWSSKTFRPPAAAAPSPTQP
jgi:hypothetical protein